MPEAKDSVLLVTAVAIRTVNGERQIDDQTCDGFETVQEFANVACDLVLDPRFAMPYACAHRRGVIHSVRRSNAH